MALSFQEPVTSHFTIAAGGKGAFADTDGDFFGGAFADGVFDVA